MTAKLNLDIDTLGGPSGRRLTRAGETMQPAREVLAGLVWCAEDVETTSAVQQESLTVRAGRPQAAALPQEPAVRVPLSLASSIEPLEVKMSRWRAVDRALVLPSQIRASGAVGDQCRFLDLARQIADGCAVITPEARAGG